jgi:GR25 family glycosyltransferase involved in LPS biosynthesis
MFIDKIIVINLDKAKERKDRIVESFSRVGIKEGDVLILSAFDGEILNNDFERRIFGNAMDRTFAKGEICCTLSHITAIKMAKALNYKSVLILEDDIELCDNFLERINSLESQLPENWDQIYLGAIVSNLGDKVSENIHRINSDSVMGTHSYILNSSAYDLVSCKLTEFNTSTDGEFNILHANSLLNAYIYIPLLTYQYSGYSYITHGDKDMENMTNKYFNK